MIQGISEGVTSGLLEGHRLHGNSKYLPVENVVAFVKKIDSLLGIRYHGNHAVGTVHQTVKAERAHHESCLAWRKAVWRRRSTAGTVAQ